MALNPNELFSETSRASRPRVHAKAIQPKTFKLGSGTLAVLTPLGKNKNTGHYEPWVAPDSEVATITKTGTVSGGDYFITIDNENTAAIAYNATAATIKAAIVALLGVGPEDVSVSGGPVSTTPVVISFSGDLAGRNLVVDVDDTNITGGGTLAAAETNAGADVAGVDKIAGFVWPDAVPLDSDEEVIGNVLMAGDIHYADIPLVGTVTADQLKAGLKDNNDVRKLGFLIQGLAGF